MNPAIAIVADDLTRAADCGVVCTAAGLETVVVLSELFRSRDWAADVIAVDADTRRASPERAAEVTERIVHELCSHGETPIVYKEIDSTLRGNFAVERGRSAIPKRWCAWAASSILVSRLIVDC